MLKYVDGGFNIEVAERKWYLWHHTEAFQAFEAIISPAP